MAFIMKPRWQILIRPQELWVRILRAKYMWGRRLSWQSVQQKHGSRIWNAIRKSWSLVHQGVKMAVVNGLGTRF